MFSFLDKVLGKWVKPTTDNGLPVQIVGTSLIMPTDIQSRACGVIVTHNAVSVPANTASVPSSWINTLDPNAPFTDFDITLANDGATSSAVDLYWSTDGTNTSAISANAIVSNTDRYRTGDPVQNFKTKAQYLKVVPKNLDTAAAHTMTVTILTKA